MKKNLIALTLVALTLGGMTGCSYPGSDEIAAEYYADARAQEASKGSTSTSTPQGSSGRPNSTAPSATAAAPPATPAEQVEITPDSDSASGTQYLQLNSQRFSPVLDVWRVDGSDVSLKQYNCTGSTTLEGTGTLAPHGSTEGLYMTTWSAGSSVANVGAVLEITDTNLRQQAGIDNAVASTDKEVEAANFAAVCLEKTGDVINIVF